VKVRYQKVVQDVGRRIVGINIAASANCEADQDVEVSGPWGDNKGRDVIVATAASASRHRPASVSKHATWVLTTGVG
jgi:hypothetical protein